MGFKGESREAWEERKELVTDRRARVGAGV